MVMERPSKKRSIADVACELTCNVLPNNLQSDPPMIGFVAESIPKNTGGSGDSTFFGSKSSAHNAGKDTQINGEEPKPSISPSLHDLQNLEETNKDQSSGHVSL